MIPTPAEEWHLFQRRLCNEDGELDKEKVIKMLWDLSNRRCPTPRFGWAPTE